MRTWTLSRPGVKLLTLNGPVPMYCSGPLPTALGWYPTGTTPWKYCANASDRVTSALESVNRAVRLSSFLIRFRSIAPRPALPNSFSFAFFVRLIE